MVDLDLDMLASGDISLADVMNAAQASAPRATTKGRQVCLRTQYTIDVAELGRLVSEGRWHDVNLQARLIMQMASTILKDNDTFTFQGIDEIAKPYIVSAQSEFIAEGLDTNVWSYVHGKGYVQLPSVAGATYIGWLTGQEEWTQTSRKINHSKQLGKYTIFVKA
tara:strand:- start:143 stop:637 length:495 start_codon:yes stop_codon:yes gene_type:complete